MKIPITIFSSLIIIFSSINSSIKVTSIASINLIKKGYFKRINGIITIINITLILLW
jgi:hypothetical protein